MSVYLRSVHWSINPGERSNWQKRISGPLKCFNFKILSLNIAGYTQKISYLILECLEKLKTLGRDWTIFVD